MTCLRFVLLGKGRRCLPCLLGSPLYAGGLARHQEREPAHSAERSSLSRVFPLAMLAISRFAVAIHRKRTESEGMGSRGERPDHNSFGQLLRRYREAAGLT